MYITFNSLKDLLRFNIKYYRYEKNISQERLAELCDSTPRYLTDVERGIHCPSIAKIEKIAEALEIKPELLFMNEKRDMEIINRIKSSRQYNQIKVNIVEHRLKDTVTQ